MLDEDLASEQAKQDLSMQAEPEPTLPEPEWQGQRCVTCHRPMKDDPRFCAACGRHNFNADASLGAGFAADFKERAKEKRRAKQMTWFLRLLRIFGL
ncbi:MAG: hypothetical protein AAF497_17620 [Planctomycetota bacterium]